MHFNPKGLKVARPIIGQSVTLSEGIWHESIEFIWRKDHLDSPIFLKSPFLLGFIVTTEEWVLDSTEKQLDILPNSEAQSGRPTTQIRLLLKANRPCSTRN